MANDIKSLVFSFLDNINIKYTETAPGMWKAMITPKEVAFFDGRTEYEFTFDRELAEKHRSLEFMSKGSFMLQKITNRLTASPKVARVFAIKEPELPKGVLSVITQRPYYRTQIAFNFKVNIESEQKTVKMLSVISDITTGSIELRDGFYEVDERLYSETPNPDYELRDENHEILKLYIESCQRVEKEVSKDIKLFRAKNEEEYEKNLEQFEDYLNDQKAELLKKKENLSFHLYFFQKEEEIDKLINGLEQQREQKVQELKEKYEVKVNIVLINALMLCVPTMGEVAQKTKK
jgi:hypothetical protein